MCVDPSGQVQEYLLMMSPYQSQGQAETQDVGEQLHGEQSSGPGETGETWKDSRAVEKKYPCCCCTNRLYYTPV